MRDLLCAVCAGPSTSTFPFTPRFNYHPAEGKTSLLWELKHHSDSCRRVCYSKDGKYLLTGSADMSVVITENGQFCCRLREAHNSPLTALVHIENAVFATGDEDGVIKVWDIRAQSETALKPMMVFKKQEDTISEFALDESKGCLMATANDGTLAAYDLRKIGGELQDISNSFEEDLLSLAVLKGGKKVVVGSQEGSLHLFSRELLQVADDRIKGHPGPVETIAKVDEDTVVTGCDDGLVRAISVHPNKILSVLYRVSEDQENVSSIQRVAVSGDKALGGVISENQIAFFNLAYVRDRDKTKHKISKEKESDPFFDNLMECKYFK
eukprot:TRINITY_DN7351_c0_g1_i1.p1 TRINITY_DN7351_c0_g1~~TRINITY_DN7351_c0_g1_i1.p1  ORF type:complete len:325 (+),score=65.45 TRINITY_DN7351_c0_g1_i1:212-1186(+)